MSTQTVLNSYTAALFAHGDTLCMCFKCTGRYTVTFYAIQWYVNVILRKSNCETCFLLYSALVLGDGVCYDWILPLHGVRSMDSLSSVGINSSRRYTTLLHSAHTHTHTFLSCPLNSGVSDSPVYLNIGQMHGTVRCGAQPNLHN